MRCSSADPGADPTREVLSTLSVGPPQRWMLPIAGCCIIRRRSETTPPTNADVRRSVPPLGAGPESRAGGTIRSNRWMPADQSTRLVDTARLRWQCLVGIDARVVHGRRAERGGTADHPAADSGRSAPGSNPDVLRYRCAWRDGHGVGRPRCVVHGAGGRRRLVVVHVGGRSSSGRHHHRCEPGDAVRFRER